jgi:hypothetical protein
MASGRTKTSGLQQTEDLEFQYRMLISAQRILEEQFETTRAQNTLQAERLRRLRSYIKSALAAVEGRMAPVNAGVPNGRIGASD